MNDLEIIRLNIALSTFARIWSFIVLSIKYFPRNVVLVILVRIAQGKYGERYVPFSDFQFSEDKIYVLFSDF